MFEERKVEELIISASRRTDIPAYYSEWFINRIRDGYLYSRNPMNQRQVSKLILTPENVDGIVFWSKSPAPLLTYLHELEPFAWYLQYTLNSYGEEIEPGLPPLSKRIDTFLRFANKTDPMRTVFRYDPIFISKKYTVSWHIREFEKVSRCLKGAAERCIISFIDMYTCMRGNAARFGLQETDKESIHLIAEAFLAIAKDNKFSLESCAEEGLEQFGLKRAACIDALLLSRISGWPVKAKKDKSQRVACGCAASRDIGMYDTCSAGCVYCYALHGKERLRRNLDAHSLDGKFLAGELQLQDIIYEHS